MSTSRRIIFIHVLTFFLLSFMAKGQGGLHIVEGPLDIIHCDSTCTMLHANFPKPLKTNQYAVSTIAYNPQTTTGTTVNLTDDKFSGAIPLGFNFCFFENVYTQCYISDNGVLTFNASYNGGNCNNNTQQLLPYFNSTFPDNGIFFMFMDMAPTLGGTIKYTTIGTAPFRKFVLNYQNMRLFGASCSTATSSFQVVLYESTNIIEVYAANKTTCDANPLNYSNFATIGVQNLGATTAFTAPGKHASIFTMLNEGLQIAPTGPLNYLLKWKDANNNVIATNVDSIYYCPSVIPYNKIRAELNLYCPSITYKDSVIIDKNLPHIDSLIIVKPLCNGDSSGLINVLASGATPPLTYSLNGGPFTSNHIFTNITNGYYYVSVKGANGCKKDTLVQILPQYNVAALLDSVKKPTCPDSNGKIFIHVANGVPPYTIVWSNGMTGTSITGLTQGSYVVTVTDANGCTTNATIILPFDSIPVPTYSVSKSICHDSSGAINVSVAGGTAPYHYLWNTGDTTQDLSNLVSGTYIVTVTDQIGCSAVVVVGVSDTLSIHTEDTVYANTSCGLNNGIAHITASYGIPPLLYMWIPSGQTTATAIGLAPGTHICITSDTTNCIEIDTVVIAPSLALVNSVSKANANCDSSNGKVYLNTVFNYNGWYHQLWNTGDTSHVVTGLSPGTYWVTTTDSLGCVKTDTLTLLNDGKPYLGLVSYTPPLCYGDSTGSITLTGSSGTAPYKYSVDGITFTSFAQITHIAGGTYTIYITDANTCPNDTVVFFPQPTQLISSYTADTVICYDDETATVSVSTIGGYSPYTYSLNGSSFGPQHVFSNLGLGVYTLVVKDSNDCNENIQVNVPGPPSALEVVIDKKDVPCFETNTGSVKLTIQGGWSPYQYTWSNGNTTLELNQIGETHALFTVVDDKGCEVSKAIDVNQLLCCKAVVPNAFSPNGDTKNDYLHVMPISDVSSVKFSIFDRWGKNIFTTKNLGESWDGKYHGTDCDVDVYFYYLEYTCPFQKEKVIQKGDVTLMR